MNMITPSEIINEQSREQCPGCGHIYFHGGSGFCKWCIEEQQQTQREQGANRDSSQWHNNCREDVRSRTTQTQRQKAADAFGENWANIMAGLGDQ